MKNFMIAYSSMEFLLLLVEDMLDFSSMEQGKFNMNY